MYVVIAREQRSTERERQKSSRTGSVSQAFDLPRLFGPPWLLRSTIEKRQRACLSGPPPTTCGVLLFRFAGLPFVGLEQEEDKF